MSNIETQLAAKIKKAGVYAVSQETGIAAGTLYRITAAMAENRGTTSIGTIDRLARHFGLRASLARSKR